MRFKCSASEGLSLYSIISVFLKAFGDRCAPAIGAYKSLCDVIDCLYLSARGKVSPQQLQESVERFLDHYVGAFGEDHTTPAFHWLLHVRDYLHRVGVLIA